MLRITTGILFLAILVSCKKDSGTPEPACDRPVASFASSFAGSLPVTVNFTNLSTTQAGSAFTWNFGDGTSSTLVNPAHSYAANGTFTVMLIHAYTAGADSIVKSIIINVAGNPGGGSGGGGGAGRTNFAFVVRAATPYIATFNNSSMSATSYLWNFGDGSPVLATNALLVNHNYAASGSYTVKLWATNCSFTDSTSRLLVLP